MKAAVRGLAGGGAFLGGEPSQAAQHVGKAALPPQVGAVPDGQVFGTDFVDEMLATKGQEKKYYRDEVEKIIRIFKAQIKEQEERLGC